MDNVEKLFGSLLRQLRIDSLPTAVDESSFNAIATVLSNAVESLLIDTPEHEQEILAHKLEVVLDQTENIPPILRKALNSLFKT